MAFIPGSGAVIAGKYELERPLARGGMGSVWVGRHRDLDIPVAVKFIAPALVASADARARFEREAKAAAQLDSGHVVHVYDYGVDSGGPYIVMELLKGEDLGERLTRERRLPLAAVAQIVGQISKALRKAHERQLVHRDLKPANIFLTIKDEEEICKVLDFGIAKALGTGLAGPATQTGSLIGSVHFMSPEQARRSKDVDFRTDLWALGVVAYRALTGRLPFPGDEIGDVIVKICTEAAMAPSTIVPGLPVEVDAFFARAFARAPDERFQSAREMALALAEIARQSLAVGRSGEIPPPATSLVVAKPPSTLPAPSSADGAPPLPVFQGAPTPPVPSPPQPIVTDEGPVVEVELTVTQVPTAEEKTDVFQASPAPGEGSLSPSLQTLHPPGRTRRLVGVAVSIALFVLVGIGWWMIEEGNQPPEVASGRRTALATAATPPKETDTPAAASPVSASAIYAASAAPTSVPVPEGTTEPTSTAQSPSSKPSDGRTRPPIPPVTKPPAEKRIPLP